MRRRKTAGMKGGGLPFCQGLDFVSYLLWCFFLAEFVSPRGTTILGCDAAAGWVNGDRASGLLC